LPGRKPGAYEWYEIQDTIDYYTEFEKPKIVFPDISLQGNFAFDAEGRLYATNTTYIIPVDDKYLLGLLNSRLMTFFYENLSSRYRGGYLRFIYQYIVQLPIRTIDAASPADAARHDRMASLVAQMLDLKRQHAGAETAFDDRRHDLARRIEQLDREIDQLVYELYGLTGDEIAIVEGRG